MMSFIINQGWDTRQVDFSNAFVQSTLVEDIYLALPSYFYSDAAEDRSNMVMNINKNIYVMVQIPMYWYNRLESDFEASGFKSSPLDTCVLYGRVMVALIYVDDVLLFGPDKYNIDEVINELEDAGL